MDNDIGVAGIAPNCQIMSISNAMAGTPNSRMNRANGINFAWQNGASIISNSWHTGGIRYDVIDDAISDACTYGRNGKGCIIVGSTGNWDIAEIDYPAILENVIAVGAIVPCGMRKSLYSCDEEYGWGSNYGNELSVVAPGLHIPTTDTNGTYINDFYGTSAACPHVAGVAALILSVNPELTWQEVRGIIEQTAQKVSDSIYSYQNDTLHPNGTWNNEMGYGLVDAYAAVSKAMGIDLYIKDDIDDEGEVPNNTTCLWNSPDIWIEDTIGNRIKHPNDSTDYLVCVRIHNRKDFTSLGTEKLYLNWAKAGINDFWYDNWTEDNLLPCGIAKGGIIGDSNGIKIPSILANNNITIKVPWRTPSSADYAYCADFDGVPWHFCLLARIHDDDTIAYEKERFASTYAMVKNHNNVAQLNVYFNKSENYRTVVRMGNPTDNTRSVNLGIDVQDNDQGERISDYADIEISFDNNIFTAVQREDVVGAVWIDSTDNIYTLRITDFDNFYLPLDLAEGQDGTILTSVHFYADIVPLDSVFTFDLILYEAEGDIAGGQHYECTRVMDRYFQAGITGDVSIVVEDTFTALYAVTIGEPADYVWYDDQGNVVGTDSVLLIPLPFQMTTYSLSITAHSDGYRAFGDTSVVIVLDTIIIDPIRGGEIITSISPNPANNQVAITYRLPNNETQAVLRILGSQGQRLYQQNISGNREVESRKIVNTSNFAPGQYKVMLISRSGRVLDSKTLIIE